jgi:hypothetical protein
MLLRRPLKLVLPPERFIEVACRHHTLFEQTMGENSGNLPVKEYRIR